MNAKLSPFYIIALILFLSSCSASGPKDKLVWSDEFNTDGAPDSTNWTYDLGTGWNGWGNNELQVYTKAPENIHVADGKLIIEARKKDGNWTSARLKSQGRKNWTYGRIEFNAKLPTGVGTWPALWMLGESIATVDWPKCGEIDVMEHVGRNPGVVQCALHSQAHHGDTPNKMSRPVPDFDTKFHTYAAQWTPDKIDFLIDNELYYTFQPAEKNKDTWPFDAPFFLIMNIAIGGNLGGQVDANLDYAKMEVDWVRVYELP